MSGTEVELHPTIDRAWLEAVAAREPLTHAYALWDLTRSPESVRFVSARRGEETVGYLLVWLGRRDRPVVHWYGGPELIPQLLGALPPPPFVAVVPPDVFPAVVGQYPRATVSTLRLMLREHAPLPVAGGVRRLARADRAVLQGFARTYSAPELEAYAGLDPGAEPAWGVFHEGRLAGVARAAVRLPRLWLVGGVFVDPARRGQGLGQAVVAAVIDEAQRAGAVCGLYVRDEPSPAPRLYEQMGFREVSQRRWLDVPAVR